MKCEELITLHAGSVMSDTLQLLSIRQKETKQLLQHLCLVCGQLYRSWPSQDTRIWRQKNMISKRLTATLSATSTETVQKPLVEVTLIDSLYHVPLSAPIKEEKSTIINPKLAVRQSGRTQLGTLRFCRTVMVSQVKENTSGYLRGYSWRWTK